MTDHEFKYWVFLSCSHQDNGAQCMEAPEVGRRCWGHWLQDALKTFSIPAEFVGQVNGRGEIIPERIDPIFRAEPEDDVNLSAEIRQALEQSRCLVVVCSPRSAQNPQMNEAVRYFKQLGRGNNIFPLVVVGEPNVGADNPPDSAHECFVTALRHPVRADGTLDTTRRAVKHMFVDARHGVEKREILANDQRNAEADLEMAKIQLIALLLGVGFNGLWRREQKRHFFDLAAAKHQAREALNQVEEAQRQTREAQNQALEIQNLPRDVQSQIQEAQHQVWEAQKQASETQKQLLEFQNKIRDTQTQLEEARQRAIVAESKFLEVQNQLEATRHQASEAQNQVLEIQNLPTEVPNQIHEAQNQVLEAQGQVQRAQNQLEETRKQAQAAQDKFIEAQSQVQEFQNQARSAQSQLEEVRQQVREAKNKLLEAQNQAREAQNQVQEIRDQTRDAQSQIMAAQNHVQAIENQGRNARRLTRVFALLAVLALLTAGTAASMAWRQRKLASQALDKAAAEAAGKFDPTPVGAEPLRQVLQNIGGAEQSVNRQRSLDQLAAGIPRTEILEALKWSSVIVNDQQRSYFQKWLLIRLGWVNPMSAMTCASTIEGRIVNDEGLDDSDLYFQLAVLDNWMRTDLSGAFNWVCQLPDADARQRALEKIIHLVQSQPDSESKNKTLSICIGELAKTDVPEALALAESLPEGVWRSALIARLWMKTDPFAVCDWINSLDLPPEIMQPRKGTWPETQFLLNANFGSPIIFPVETDLSSNTTNGPIPIKSQE